MTTKHSTPNPEVPTPLPTKRSTKRNTKRNIERDTKRCADCHQLLPVASFYASQTNGDHLSSYCRPCTSQRNIANAKRLRAFNNQLRLTTSRKQKQCKKCKAIYPATSNYFYNSSSHSGGLNPICKLCSYKIDHPAPASAPTPTPPPTSAPTPSTQPQESIPTPQPTGKRKGRPSKKNLQPGDVGYIPPQRDIDIRNLLTNKVY